MSNPMSEDGALQPIAEIRRQIPALNDRDVALDGAAGTQAPQVVIDAVGEAMRSAMSNVHGAFGASEASTETVDQARVAIADLVGGVPEGVVLGPSMTALTFRIANALSKSWGDGDEIVVTSLDHDANIRPWRIAAERAGATVRVAEFDPDSGELPPAAVAAELSDRTRLVAFTAASNAIGTRPDVAAISGLAHAAGALAYVDGVHSTPHVFTDVEALGADFYACSTYKFCGPHVGTVTADPALLETLAPDKLVPAPDSVPDRFERGTGQFELLAGVRAAVDWLAGLTTTDGSRRERLLAAFTQIERVLGALMTRMVAGISAIDGVNPLGSARVRTSTLSFTVEGITPDVVAKELARRRIAVWAGDNYAYELMGRYGLAESGGAIRASIVLYNSQEDVDRFVTAVREIAATSG